MNLSRLLNNFFNFNLKCAFLLAAQADHVDSDCFVCVFLSHGENDKVWAHDQEISIDEVTDNFKGDKCRSLVRKPKIFILQV